MKIWSVNYVLHFGSVKIHKHCLHWNVFSTDINGKIIFNCFLLFKLFLLPSKLNESSQYIPQFFSDILRNWGKVYVWGILVLLFMESSIPMFQNLFKLSFIRSVNCSSHFFSPFLMVRKLYELNLWFQRCPEAQTWIYIWEILVLLSIKSSICTICTYSDFFLVCKLYSSGLEIILVISDYLRFMGSVGIGDF